METFLSITLYIKQNIPLLALMTPCCNVNQCLTNIYHDNVLIFSVWNTDVAVKNNDFPHL